MKYIIKLIFIMKNYLAKTIETTAKNGIVRVATSNVKLF